MLNPHLIALRIIIAIIPLEYWLDLMGGTPSSSVLIIVMIAGLALLEIFKNGYRGQEIRILWFTASIAAILMTHILRHIPFAINFDGLRSGVCLLVGYISLRMLWRINPKFRTPAVFLGATLLPTLFAAPSVDVLNQAIQHLPLIYDPILYRFDDMLDAGRVYTALVTLDDPSLNTYLSVIYLYTLLWALLAAISQSVYTPNYRAYLPLCTLATGLLGFGLYYLAPAIGPAPFFNADFPAHLPQADLLSAAPVRSDMLAFRNAMPSLHTATAILIVLALRDSPLWQRALGLALAVSIVLSTIVLGEHYIVDLIAACPLVLFVRSISAINLPLRDPARQTGIIVGAVMMAGWIACIHAGSFVVRTPDILPVLAGASVLAFLVLEPRLHRAEQRLDRTAPAKANALRPANPHQAPYRV